MSSLKVFWNTVGRDVRVSLMYYRVFSFIKRCHKRGQTPLSLYAGVVGRYRDRVCFVYEEQEWTYAMVEDWSNRLAQLFWSRGFRKGDEVALLMENCPEYVCAWLGLAKIGVVTALINTNQQGESLAHSINVVEAKAVIFGAHFAPAVQVVLPSLRNRETLELFCYTGGGKHATPPPSFQSLDHLLEDASPEALDPKLIDTVGCQDKLLYIYTSGTTGLPKAAIIRLNKLLWTAAASKFCCDLGEDETYYNPLPLYHTSGGLVFVSVVLLLGGKMVIRKKFSATNYWSDCVRHQATIGQYIGEMCRYLLNQPPGAVEHSIRLMFGNGLKRHLWEEFQERFHIPRIVEIYGSTEGNANLVNAFGKAGAVGFLPRIGSSLFPISLIRVDPETRHPIRNDRGFCVRCKPGEPGEVVGKIINNGFNTFDGYANQEETDKKIVKDCFRKGDIAFLSGDMLVMDEEGYLYFLDRMGDTFRWRGENVSSTEVENVLSKALGHAACVVYGVEIPNAEGRAGMAVVEVASLEEEMKWSKLYEDVSKSLPPYALPLFIRIAPIIEETGTYKLRKVSLQKEGYDPGVVADPLFFLDRKRKTYVPLTPPLYSDIVEGTVKL